MMRFLLLIPAALLISSAPADAQRRSASYIIDTDTASPSSAIAGRSAASDPFATVEPAAGSRRQAGFIEADRFRPAVAEAGADTGSMYPVLGAVLGGVAGAIYAHANYSGENKLGWAVEPAYIFVPVGAVVGALIGLIVQPR